MIKCKYSYDIKRERKKPVLPCGEKAFAGLQAKRHCGSVAAKYWCCLINGAQRYAGRRAWDMKKTWKKRETGYDYKA